MPKFLLISTHSPENCPMFNENARQVYLEYVAKAEALFKKHDTELVGSWIASTEHIIYVVLEAPSLEAFLETGYEPEIAAMSAFSTVEIKLIIDFEEGMESLKEA
jgi:hypothetical protein